MNTKHLLISCLAICGLLTGCLSEPDFEPVEEGSGIEISLDGSIKQIATKVTAEGFETGDALGLYAVNYENNNQTPGTLLTEGNQADHVKYIFNFENWQWTPVKKVYYKDINTNVDLYVFYPHAEPSSIEEYNFEVHKDQSKAKTTTSLGGYEASDFLWAKVENVAPTEGKIKVQLDHKMAGVHVILAEGTGFEEGEFALIAKSVLATGVTRKASINMATGIITPVGEEQATGIVMCPQTDGSFRAVVAPQTVAAQTSLFSITIEGLTYKFRKDADFTYEAGKVSQFTIKINRKTPTGEYELDLVESTIVPWIEDLNVHEGEARQYYCVNVTEPGTLGRLIKEDKKNPMKIKNLKVSGTISDEDFYFMRDSMAILEAINLKESRVVDVKCSKLTLQGHNDEYGKSTIFTTREAGTYDDVIPDNAFNNKSSLFYFTFPEKITQIGDRAFCRTSISGSLVIPDDVTHIWDFAFYMTNISSLILGPSVNIVGAGAFANCTSLSGTLNLPDSIIYLGYQVFSDCGFSGQLILPNSLKYIGHSAFMDAGDFRGGLSIPENIQILYDKTFSSNSYRAFSGTLTLRNVTEIGAGCFHACRFSGEVIFPEGLTTSGEAYISINGSFMLNNFTSIQLPSTMKIINAYSFKDNKRLTSINFPEGLVSIQKWAFYDCSQLQSLEFPSTLQTIQADAFKGCTGVTSIICHSTEPPTVQSGAFDGVPKDNFTLEVPANAVNRYATDPMWGQFKRISAHYDFSMSR